MQSKTGINYTYDKRGSATLCVMLSGTNYTYDKPLMYYGAMLMKEKNIDTVQVHYHYDDAFFTQATATINERITADVSSVIDEVLEAERYERILFYGKSMGTLPLSHAYVTAQWDVEVAFIILTPLLQFEGFTEGLLASDKPMFVVIGTEDGHYRADHVKLLAQKATLLEIPGANHSLEQREPNVGVALQHLLDIQQGIQQFMKGW